METVHQTVEVPMENESNSQPSVDEASGSQPHSTLMLLTNHDSAIHNVRSDFSATFDQLDLSGSLKQADAIFKAIMDPNNAEAKEMISKLFQEPMQAITKTLVETINCIDASDPGRVADQVKAVVDVVNLIPVIRKHCLDSAYESLQQQLSQFSSSVDVFNEKMRATYVQTLELFETRVHKEISARKAVLEQKKSEHGAYLECMLAEADVRAFTMRTMADAQKYREEKDLAIQHEKEEKDMDRAARKAEMELEKERKKNEMENKKLDAEIERVRKRDQTAHERAMKGLEAKSVQTKIDQETRDGIIAEYNVVLAVYNEDFKLASDAMRSSISQRGSSCWIRHSAPKINWGPPPRVVPGSISWRASN